MSNKGEFRQCTLRRRRPAPLQGDEVQVSWIPAKYAKVGEVVKLRENGVWTDGWVVVEIGDIARDESQLPDGHKERRQHRRNTGDSDRKG